MILFHSCFIWEILPFFCPIDSCTEIGGCQCSCLPKNTGCLHFLLIIWATDMGQLWGSISLSEIRMYCAYLFFRQSFKGTEIKGSARCLRNQQTFSIRLHRHCGIQESNGEYLKKTHGQYFSKSETGSIRLGNWMGGKRHIPVSVTRTKSFDYVVSSVFNNLVVSSECSVDIFLHTVRFKSKIHFQS